MRSRRGWSGAGLEYSNLFRAVRPGGPGRRVLIVEDEPWIAEMYAIGLQRDGWQVEIAPTAEEGLRQALSTPPDLLLLDIMLPGMDGVEMLSRLRSNPQTQNLPVLVLSNSPGLSGKLQRARSLGILGWLTKSSTTPRELASEIRPFLK